MKPSLICRYSCKNSDVYHGHLFKKDWTTEIPFFNAPGKESFIPPAASVIQRKCDKCEEEEEKQNIQKKENSGETTISTTGLHGYVQSLSGKGATLSVSDQHFFKARWGYDFSSVKVHTDRKAAASAKALNARVYTYQNNIVFADGQYNPASPAGKSLLAHELVHVVQQRQKPEKQIQKQSVATLGKIWGGALVEPSPFGEIFAAGATVVIVGPIIVDKAGDVIEDIFKPADIIEVAKTMAAQKAKPRAISKTRDLPVPRVRAKIRLKTCSAYSNFLNLLPPISVMGATPASIFGDITEGIIETDYCLTHGCSPATHYFDQRDPSNYVNFLIQKNPKLKRKGFSYLRKNDKHFVRPDILSHTAALKDYYEIKPASDAGIAAGKQKLSDLRAMMDVYSLPYTEGTSYLSTPKEIVLAVLGDTIISLKFFRKAPGLITYEICFSVVVTL